MNNFEEVLFIEELYKYFKEKDQEDITLIEVLLTKTEEFIEFLDSLYSKPNLIIKYFGVREYFNPLMINILYKLLRVNEIKDIPTSLTTLILGLNSVDQDKSPYPVNSITINQITHKGYLNFQETHLDNNLQELKKRIQGRRYLEEILYLEKNNTKEYLDLVIKTTPNIIVNLVEKTDELKIQELKNLLEFTNRNKLFKERIQLGLTKISFLSETLRPFISLSKNDEVAGVISLISKLSEVSNIPFIKQIIPVTYTALDAYKPTQFNNLYWFLYYRYNLENLNKQKEFLKVGDLVLLNPVPELNSNYSKTLNKSFKNESAKLKIDINGIKTNVRLDGFDQSHLVIGIIFKENPSRDGDISKNELVVRYQQLSSSKQNVTETTILTRGQIRDKVLIIKAKDTLDFTTPVETSSFSFNRTPYDLSVEILAPILINIERGVNNRLSENQIADLARQTLVEFDDIFQEGIYRYSLYKILERVNKYYFIKDITEG